MAKIRSVQEYLDILKLGGKAPLTIKNYRSVLNVFAEFLGVPLTELHHHLTVENLTRFAANRTDKSTNGRKASLSVIHRYMSLNGVVFDELEHNVVKIASDEDRTDKPLELKTLQAMMDQGDAHSRAILAFLISTGCRAGECSKLLLSDVDGDTVTIRNAIAKRKKGGVVFLTKEAREFLDIWLKDRDRYIKDADMRTSKLVIAGTGHQRIPRKGIGFTPKRPKNDQRLFACSYGSIDKIFGRLYRRVDGERGKYRAAVTAHSCRAYFRTHAAETMSIDLVEGLLRHSGYLNSAYVRMTEGERRKQFHAGEASLYITRADHRVQTGKLDALERENLELKKRLEQVETDLTERESMEQMVTEMYKKFQEEKQNARHFLK